MFFIFSKTLSLFFMPIFWLFSLLTYVIFSRRKERKKKALYVFLGMFLLLSNPFISNLLLLYWETPPKAIKDLKSTDIGIVLTGITGFKEPNDRVYFYSHADRIWHALLLYKQGKIKKILITGGNIDIFGKEKESEATRLAVFLRTAEVPKEDIIIENKARNTKENAVFTAQIIKEKYPNASLTLITSGFHMARAKGCFEKVGLKFEVFSAGFYTENLKETSFHSFVPSEKSLYHNYIFFHEVLGYITYKILGYL
jgi:uncharacterized SAM-binding protein YcdF (DUF218 family)